MNDLENQSAPPATDTARHPTQVLGWIPLTISLETELESFTVRDLIHLGPGEIVRARLSQSAEIPLLVNGKLIAWAKLEVTGDRLAARITELA